MFNYLGNTSIIKNNQAQPGGGIYIDRHRKVIVSLLTLSLAITLFTPLPAFSSLSSKKASLSRKKSEVSRTKSNLEHLARDYEEQHGKFLRVVDKTQAVRGNILRQEQRLRNKQTQLGNRVDFIYRNGRVNVIEVILGSSNFGQFLDRWEYFARIADADASLISQVKGIKSDLEYRERQLKTLRDQQKETLRELNGRRRTMESTLRMQQAVLRNLGSEIKRAERAAAAAARDRQRSSGGGRGEMARAWRGSNNFRVIDGLVFPLQAPYSFTDTFGAPRSGGRTHKGTDIFAVRGQPVRAVNNGTVSTKHSGLGGRTIQLRADDGNTYYYAHLDSFAVSGGRVSKGDVIGFNGDSGNARGGSPHVHFEIWPGGCSKCAINPYHTLKRISG